MKLDSTQPQTSARSTARPAAAPAAVEAPSTPASGPVDGAEAPRAKAPDAEPGAEFLAPGFSPQTIGELAAYRKANRARRAAGLAPLPELAADKMPPDQPMPEAFRGFLRKLDGLLPGVLEKFDGEFARGESTPFHKTVLGANTLMMGLLASDIATKVSGAPDLAELAVATYLGVKGADVFTYVGHHFFDNYDLFEGMSHEALEFQAHHFDPKEVTGWEDVMTVGNSGLAMLPLFAVTSALAAGGVTDLGTEAGLMTFAACAMLSPLFHKWTHMPRPPKLAQWGQDIGLFVDKKTHLGHHAGKRTDLLEGEAPLRHVDSTGLVSGRLGGDVNAWLDRMQLPRHIERAFYLVSEKMRGPGKGIEPVSWQEYPELRAWKLPKAERAAALREGRATRYEGQIHATERRAREAEDPKLKAGLEAKAERMKVQLDALRNPQQVEDLKRDYEAAQAALRKAESDLSSTFAVQTPLSRGEAHLPFSSSLFLDRYRKKEALQSKVEQLAAQLEQLAPVLA